MDLSGCYTQCARCKASLVIAQTVVNVKLGIPPKLDGVLCDSCDEKRIRRNAKARKARRERDDAMRMLGLEKVRSVTGKVYWE